jgi:hypothetical protein
LAVAGSDDCARATKSAPPWEAAYFPGNELSSSSKDWKVRSIPKDAAYPENNEWIATVSAGNRAGSMMTAMERGEEGMKSK